MAIIDSSYIGSFQSGMPIASENPLEDVWSLLGLYASEEYIKEHITTVGNKGLVSRYVAVRMRQAIELRTATRGATLLTAPLTLYYSLLNLTRAAMAVRNDILSSKSHGLSFKNESSILKCRAEIKNGTFRDYLKIDGTELPEGIQVSLDDCLSRIIETASDYFNVADNPPLVSPVGVKAYRQSGNMFLKFSDTWIDKDRFHSHWQTDYPTLSDSCDLETEPGCLRVKDSKKPKNLQDVHSICSQILEVNLMPINEPTWFVVRVCDPNIVWPRPAYYLAASFILGNVVRYQPEVMYRITANHSKWGWLLRRFMVAAERFYPNLMLNWIHGTTYFFGR
jgi:hypothetical protein